MARPMARSLALAALLTVATGSLVVAIHRTSFRTAVSAHGMLHTAVADQFRDWGERPVPLENPYFAGEQLPYYWVFHWSGAKLADWLGVHPLRAFELMIILALGLMWFSAALLGRWLFGGWAAGVAIGFLALAGANALGALALGWKLLVGGAQFPVDGPGYLWGIAHPVLGMARIADPHALYGPLINFYFNITGRPVALAALLLTTAMTWFWLDRGHPAALPAVAGGAFLSAAFSPIIGLPAGLSLGGGLTLVALLSRKADKNEKIRLVVAAAAIGVGVILAIPTFSQLFGQTGSGVTLGIRGSSLVGVVASAAPLAILAGWSTWRLEGGPARRFLVAVMAGAAVLLGAAVVTEIRASNDTNFFHSAAYLLAIPAAAVFAVWRIAPARILLLMALVFGPTAALVTLSYLRRPPVQLTLEGSTLVRLPADGAHARMYRWIRDNTPAQAIFIADPEPPLETVLGNTPEFPALTGRSLFTAQRGSYMVDPYPDADLRHEIAVTAITGGDLERHQREYLAGLSRPIYLITRSADGDSVLDRLSRRYGDPEFGSANLAVFHLTLTNDGEPVNE